MRPVSRDGELKSNKKETEKALTDFQGIVKGWRRLFTLPFVPVWRNCLTTLAVFLVYISIYYAGFQHARQKDTLIQWDLTNLIYCAQLMYLIDILLTIGCRFLHGLHISPTEIFRPKWVLFADILSVIPIRLFMPSTNVTFSTANFFYFVDLNQCFKLARIFHEFYHNNNTVGSSLIHLQVYEYNFLLGLASLIGFVFTLNIVCSNTECPDPLTLDNYLEYFQISLSTITGRGIRNYPTYFSWIVFYNVTQLLTFMCVICTSISYVAIAALNSMHHKYHYFNNLRLMTKELESLKVPAYISDQCMEYFDAQWKDQTGLADRTKIFMTLPRPMFEEISLDVHWRTMQHSKLLRNMDTSFLRYVALITRSEGMLPGKILYKKHESKNKMIYVVSGVVQILSEEDDETPILSFSRGTCLGESCLILNYNSKATVRCKTYCNLHILDAKEFTKTIEHFPRLFGIMRREFEQRLKDARKHHDFSTAVNALQYNANRIDHITVMWLKTTLHRLMIKDGDTSMGHQCQSVFMRDEFAPETFSDRYFNGDNLDMLAISERLELVTDSVFLNTSCPCIFQPESIFLNCWEILIVTLAISAGFCIPYFAFVEATIPLWYLAWVYLITIFWWLDLYVQISSAITTPYEILATVTTIFLHRISTAKFALDFVAAVPFEVLASILLTHVCTNSRALLYLNRVIKMWRIRGMFDKLENKQESNLKLLRYVKYSCVFLYALFFGSCYLYSVNCFDEDCEIPLIDGEPLVQFLWCGVVVTEIFSGITFSSILIGDSMYYPYYLLFGLIATIFNIFVCGNLAAVYALKRASIVSLKEMLTDIHTIIKSNRLSHKYDIRISNYVETQWLDNEAATLLVEKSGFMSLPDYIYGSLRESNYMVVLSEIPIFRNLPEFVIFDICAIVHNIILPPNEVVCYTGEICDTFYIIQKGYCKVASNPSTTKQSILGPSSTISTVESCLRVPIVNTVITVTHCYLLSIDYERLQKIYLKYPEHKKELQTALTDEDIERNLMLLLSRTSTYVPKSYKKETESFFKFGYNLKIDSMEEYDYFFPFDRLDFLSFVQYFLMRYTVLPHGTFFYNWEICRSICAISSALFFGINETGTCSDCPWFYIRVFLDAMAWLDIYVRLHVCYFNKDGILVYHPLKTATHYLKHGFLVDLLAVFPVHIFFPTWKRDKNKYLAILQINRVLQMHRCLGFFNYIAHSSLMHHNIMPILKYFPFILILCASVGSLVTNIICDFGQGIEGTKIFTNGVSCHQNSWIVTSDFRKPLTPYRVQAYGVYFATSILTLSGMMGFKLESNISGFFVMIMTIFAYLLSIHLTSTAIAEYIIQNSTLHQYQDCMSCIRKFMRTNKINIKLQQQLSAHYELKWHRKRGRDIHESIAKFHPSLKQDILFDVYGAVLEESSIFNIDSKAFLRSLLLEVAHDVGIKDSCLAKINDVSGKLHIVYRGEAIVLAPDGIQIATLTSGSLFGNLDNSEWSRLTITVLANGHVEILTISSQRFHAILRSYPGLNKRYAYLTGFHTDYVEGKGRLGADGEVTINVPVVEISGRKKKTLCVIRDKVFYPESWGIRAWQFLILTVVCYVAVCLNLYQMAMAEYHLGLIIFQCICHVLYVLNYYVITHTAYENDIGVVVSDLIMIRQRFRQNRLMYYLTLFSMVPLDVLSWTVTIEELDSYSLFQFFVRVNTSLRFIYVINYFNEQKQSMTLNLYIFRFAFILLWSTFSIHVCICILINFSCSIEPAMYPNIKCGRLLDSWYEKASTYGKCYYLIVSSFTHSSQGMAYPESFFHIIYCILIMISLELLSAIFVAQVYATMEMGYHEQNKYARSVDFANCVLEREKASDSLLFKTNNYLVLLWKRQRGTTIPKFLKLAPTFLRESTLNSAFAHHVNNHAVFSKCHEDFNRQIVACFKRRTFFRGDYIVFQGSINNCMYFVHQGEVLAMQEDEGAFAETFVARLGAGSSFGIAQGLFPDKPFPYSFRASKSTVVLKLNINHWKHLLHFYPASESMIIQSYLEYDDRFV